MPIPLHPGSDNSTGPCLHHRSFALPLSGADIVLGVECLKGLGPVTIDYTVLSMSFTHWGQPIQLFRDVPIRLATASTHRFKRMLHTPFLSALFHSTNVPNQTQPPTSSSPISDITTHPPITSLIAKLQFLFTEPSGLPPHRPITHHIHLLPESNQVNVKPYCYPHSQKAEFERQVSSMMDVGLI